MNNKVLSVKEFVHFLYPENNVFVYGRKRGWLEDEDERFPESQLTRRTAARILHQYIKIELGIPDLIDTSGAEILKDLYTCRSCANHIAQVYMRGFFEANEIESEGRIVQIFNHLEYVTVNEVLPKMKELEVREGYKKLTQFLIKKNISITTMESATSGQIASLITDTEGASSIFKGAFITYSNEAKVQAGVDSTIIEKYSVYSKETAEAMAIACKNAFSADIGIGVTGTMGNIDPANSDYSKPGEVYFSIIYGEKKYSFKKELVPEPTRLAYKLSVAEIILKELNIIICLS